MTFAARPAMLVFILFPSVLAVLVFLKMSYSFLNFCVLVPQTLPRTSKYQNYVYFAVNVKTVNIKTPQILPHFVCAKLKTLQS